MPFGRAGLQTVAVVADRPDERVVGHVGEWSQASLIIHTVSTNAVHHRPHFYSLLVKIL